MPREPKDHFSELRKTSKSKTLMEHGDLSATKVLTDAKKKTPRTQEDRMDYYTPHKKVTLPKEDLDRIHVKDMGEFEGYRVWLVDGEIIRDSEDVDFVEGGNPGRYLYVPEGEIWIEENVSKKDYLATMIHEWYECTLMIEDGLSYSDAHDQAAEIEKDIRNEIDLGHEDILSS